MDSDHDGSGGLAEDTKDVLIQVNERTKHIDSRVDKIADSVEGNQGDINDLEDDVQRNTTVINGITVGGIAVITWISDKISRFFPL